ncbi:MAG TPA: hypothetical protein VGQ98_09865 [Gemmatimonadaceae bacterium]|nr:hypothetical protein [Gemmatimonadaceae bacterium]
MTHHPSLIPGKEPLAGDANSRKQEVERAGATLTNPGCRAPVS